MNFFLQHKKIIAQYLLGVFMVSTVLLPALVPITASANAATPGITGDQASQDAVGYGSNNFNDTPDFGCFSTSPEPVGCLAMGTYYMLKFSYWIVGYMSIFFNFALNELVMGMGSLVKEMTGIMVAWKTIRDVTNVFLVFLTVYIGIATILGISGFGAKQLLWKVVLAALLVNFSVTFTKVVIDISNLTAVQVYTMFEQSFVASGGGTGMTGCDVDTVTTGVTNINNNDCMTHGIAAAFWSQLHVTSIFKMDALTAQSGPQRPDVYWTMTFTFFMASILFIVMAFAFGAAGFLLVGRFVILVFLLIMSPLALVLWITGISSQGRAWWNALLKQSIFPAAILLCWWIAYTILASYAASFNSSSLSEIGTPNPQGIAVVSTFIIIIGFLIAGLILATKLGAYGAKTIMKTGENWSRKAAGAVGAVAVGTGAYVAATGVRGVGGVSSFAARKQRESIARTQIKDENGEYVDKTLRGRFHQTAVGRKAARGINKVVAAPSNAKFGKAQSYNERKSAVDKAVKEQKTEHTKYNRASTITSAIKSSDPTTTAKVLRDASVSELNDNADTFKKNPNSIAHVSRSNYAKLRENKDGTFTEDELRTFDDARKSHYTNMDADAVKEVVKSSNPKDLAEHDIDFLKRPETVRQIDLQTLTSMQKSGLSQEKREAMRSVVEEQYSTINKGSQTSSLVLGPNGQPASTGQGNVTLTTEEQNIVNLHKWFNDNNRMPV